MNEPQIYKFNAGFHPNNHQIIKISFYSRKGITNGYLFSGQYILPSILPHKRNPLLLQQRIFLFLIEIAHFYFPLEILSVTSI